ncbi:5'/3'-nucleotidase SurE [Dactylosporangium sp. NPDC049140]|uniref:5'/3'-nucleotidase SurE n=1 Tax=Dactylosporangium sp. NPDC049140 TaxID=3155647 RepID=UPI0033D599C6
MRIVVTNDDGVGAPGIRHLARLVRAGGHDVVVAAPHAEVSGAGAALSATVEGGRLLYEAVELDGLAGVPVYSVPASPAYIAVLAGLGAFGGRPDALLSGINRGANAGHAVLHSGTVGAVLTGATDGLRGLAVSLDILGDPALNALPAADDARRCWPTAAAIASGLLDWLAAAPEGTALNLNVPDRPLGAVAGLRPATLAPFGQVQMTLVESGTGFVRTALRERGAERVPGSDVALLAEGYATVTAVLPPVRHPTVAPPEDWRRS